MDLSQHNDTRPAIVPIEFRTDYEPDPAKPGEMRAVDWVKWVKKGGNSSETEDKVARVQKHNAVVWGVIEVAYQAWKRGIDAPVDGVPLDATPFVTREQVKVLRAFHIRSVEDLAAATDSTVQRVGLPGIRQLISKAHAYLKAKEGEAVVAAALADRDQTIDELRQQLAELTATVTTLTAGKPQREKPGNIADAE